MIFVNYYLSSLTEICTKYAEENDLILLDVSYQCTNWAVMTADGLLSPEHSFNVIFGKKVTIPVTEQQCIELNIFPDIIYNAAADMPVFEYPKYYTYLENIEMTITSWEIDNGIVIERFNNLGKF